MSWVCLVSSFGAIFEVDAINKDTDVQQANCQLPTNNYVPDKILITNID